MKLVRDLLPFSGKPHGFVERIDRHLRPTIGLEVASVRFAKELIRRLLDAVGAAIAKPKVTHQADKHRLQLPEVVSVEMFNLASEITLELCGQ